jgi:hypothetical protein
MKRLILYFLFAFLFLASSCKTSKKTSVSHIASTIKADTTIHHRQDSAYFEKIQTIHDTQFITKPDSATIRALIKCNDRGEAFLQQIISLKNGRHISQSLKLHNNILTASAQIDSARIYFAWKETHIKEGKTTVIIDSTQKTNIQKDKSVLTTKKTVTRWPAWLYIIIIAGVVYLFIRYVLPIAKKFLI